MFYHSLLSHLDTPYEQPQCDVREVLRKTPPGRRPDVLLRTIQEAVARTLGFSQPSDIDVTRPLPEIGIDSLTAILIRNQLAGLLGLVLSANIALIHPSLEALSRALLPKLLDQPGAPCTASGPDETATSVGHVPGLNMAAIRKGCLDPSFTFDNVAPTPTCPQVALVTGGTGFVGAFLVHELLEQGIVTICLVRAKSAEHARERIVNRLQDYGLWRPAYEKLFHPAVGDVSQLRLGVGDEAFTNLASQVDAVYHASGLVDWLLPLRDYMGPSIISTHEVLRLAATGKSKAIHFISTFATLSRYLGYEVPEDEFKHGYSTSKWLAEQMVGAARWRGAQASIYRLPFITASAISGHFRLDRGDFLHNLITGSIELGSLPALDGDLSIVLPVDYVSKTIVSMSTDHVARIGQDFDFMNSHAPSFKDYFQLISNTRAARQMLPFPIWREQALAYAAAHSTSSLARIAALLDGTTTAEGAAAMFKPLLPPSRKNVLGSDEFPAPVVNEQSVGKYLGCIYASQGK